MQKASALEKLAAAHQRVFAPHSQGIWDASMIPTAVDQMRIHRGEKGGINTSVKLAKWNWGKATHLAIQWQGRRTRRSGHTTGIVGYLTLVGGYI